MTSTTTNFLMLLISCCILSCSDSKKKQPENNIPPPQQPGDSITEKETENSRNLLYPLPDISPMDMCYFPTDYTKLKMTNAIQTQPLARVIYSRPHLQGRKLFEEIIPYGEIWRLGANESTELDLFSDATIQGKKIKTGRYVLYAIPEKDNWTIIFNSNTDSWGLQPDPSKDIARFTIPVEQISNRLEYFTMVFSKTEKGADLIMAWENTEARLPLVF